MIKMHEGTSVGFQAFTNKGRAPVIMQILPELNSGGVEQGVIDLNAEISKVGGVSLVVSNGGKRETEIAKAGGVHITLPVHSKNPIVIAANIGRLRKLIHEKKVDIVHACSRAPAWSALNAVRGTQARYVTSCHSAHSVTGNVKRFYNSSITKGERVIAVSHYLEKYILSNYKINPENLRVIHRGISLDRFHPVHVTADRMKRASEFFGIPEGMQTILLPARFTRSKGHKFVLAALEKLNRPDLFCIFLGSEAGKDSYREELKNYISAKGMASNVRIASYDDMPAAYMLATVVAAPTTIPEGFGRVPVEAQAMGRPIITTDHGGVRETVLHGLTGWLVSPSDVNELASAFQEALSLTATARSEMATRAMLHVAKNFTNEKMGRNTMDVYAELLLSKRIMGSSNGAIAIEQNAA